jgi:membrane associated rhomboid family serine protease
LADWNRLINKNKDNQMSFCPGCGKVEKLIPGKVITCSLCKTNYYLSKRNKVKIKISRFPYIILILVMINIFVFIITKNDFDLGIQDKFVTKYAVIPLSGYYDKNDGDPDHYYDTLLAPGNSIFYRSFTYLFLHANISHLIVNMIGLLFFGIFLIQKMKTSDFIVFYLLTGYLSGFITSSLLNVPVIGASCSIYGILFAFAWYYPYKNFPFISIDLPLKYSIFIYAGIEFFLLLNKGNEIVHIAYLFGLIFAFFYLILFHNSDKRLFREKKKA